MQYAHNRYMFYSHHPGIIEETEYRHGVRNEFLAHRPWSPTELYNHFANFPGAVEDNFMVGEDEARINSPEAPRPF